MVRIQRPARTEDSVRVVAWANNCLNLDQLLLMIGVLNAVSLALAVMLAWIGFWPVLIFAILHLALTGGALFYAWLRNQRRDIVEIDADGIRIIQDTGRGRATNEFSGSWTRVEVMPPHNRWYPHRVLVGEYGRQVEVGRFLNDEERLELAEYIRQSLAPHSAWSEYRISN